MSQHRSGSLWGVLGLTYAFLYLPIASLVIYSFNDSRLVTVWSHFSTRWYGELLNNSQLLDAAWLSLRIACVSATAAVCLGMLAAIGLRGGNFPPQKVALEVLLFAPLVLPEVVLGFSALLLFVLLGETLGWPLQRGASTIVIVHTTMGTAYAAAVLRARLSQLDPALEAAALDLGATPWRCFLRVTLPSMAPGLVAAWLLTFTLSLDDVVIASFVTGPGASTLPIVLFSSVRLGVSPQINALATLLLGFVMGLVIPAVLILRGGVSQLPMARERGQ